MLKTTSKSSKLKSVSKSTFSTQSTSLTTKALHTKSTPKVLTTPKTTLQPQIISTTFQSTNIVRYGDRKYKRNKKSSKQHQSYQQDQSHHLNQFNQDQSQLDSDHIPTTPHPFSPPNISTTDPNHDPTQQQQPKVDIRDLPGYRKHMTDKPKANVYSDPTMITITHGIPTGQSYSNNHRPKWVLDLYESLNNTPDVKNPDLQFPIFDTTQTSTRIHDTFKVPMNYSSDITLPYLPTSHIKIKYTKHPKPNLALLLSYRGTGFQGLQIQFQGENEKTHLKTIEGELLNSILKAGYISESNAKNPFKAKWSRAARTDKGVHAATNLINVRLQLPYAEQIPEVMYVSKKAQKYASQRYPILYTAAVNYIQSIIANGNVPISIDEDVVSEKGTDVVNDVTTTQTDQTDTNNDKTITNPQDTEDEIITPPKLLTTQQSELITLCTEHIAVDILGQLTISPDFIYTLTKFNIIPTPSTSTTTDTTSQTTYKQFINDITQTVVDTLPKHEFTAWEQHLLHLYAQIGNEWIVDNRDDDDEDKDEKDENGTKAEITQNNDVTTTTDTTTTTTTTTMTDNQQQPQQQQQQKQGNARDREKDKLSKRQKSFQDTQWRRSKRSTSIPYIKQKGWNEDDVALLTNPDFLSDCLISKLRQYLPNQLHIVRAIKVSSSFDAKLQASSRTYEYIIPSFAFMPIEQYPEGTYERMLRVAQKNALNPNAVNSDNVQGQIDPNTKNKNGKRNRQNDNNNNNDDDDEVDTNDDDKSTTTFDIDDIVPPKELLQYKLSPQQMVDIQFTLSHFLGTRLHHNFTSGKKPTDPSAKRFIRSFKPIGVFTINDVEFVHMCVHGDSFLLHQIRKMIGFSMSLIRGNYNDITLDAKKPCVPDQRLIEPYNAALLGQVGDINNLPQPSPKLMDVCQHAFGHVFDMKRYNIPPAPALGLLLDHIHYDTHDFKTQRVYDVSIKKKIWSHLRDTIYASYMRAVPIIHQIKQKEIYPEIAIQELSTSNAWRWLHLLNLLDFSHARLDDNGVPLKRTEVNHQLVKKTKNNGGIVDVHGNQGTSTDIQYVQLDATTTAAIPTFIDNTTNTIDSTVGSGTDGSIELNDVKGDEKNQ